MPWAVRASGTPHATWAPAGAPRRNMKRTAAETSRKMRQTSVLESFGATAYQTFSNLLIRSTRLETSTPHTPNAESSPARPSTVGEKAVGATRRYTQIAEQHSKQATGRSRIAGEQTQRAAVRTKWAGDDFTRYTPQSPVDVGTTDVRVSRVNLSKLAAVSRAGQPEMQNMAIRSHPELTPEIVGAAARRSASPIKSALQRWSPRPQTRAFSHSAKPEPESDYSDAVLSSASASASWNADLKSAPSSPKEGQGTVLSGQILVDGSELSSWLTRHLTDSLWTTHAGTTGPDSRIAPPRPGTPLYA